MNNCDIAFNPSGLKIRYKVEIINDRHTWDAYTYACDHCTSKNPWDYFMEKSYNNFEDAITYYMVWYTNKDCYFLALWMEIYDADEESIYEEQLEPRAGLISYIRKNVTEGTADRMRRAEYERDEIAHKAALMQGFIKKMGPRYEKLFTDYCIMEEGHV